MGIPAVVGATGATTAIKEAQWIEVDGGAGTVSYDVTGPA
jgi:phosphohistidine swiveling domain-containing protein